MGPIRLVEQMFFHQMGDDLCIGFRGEFMPFLGKLSLQGEIVFHDSIVDNHNFPGAVAVGMGILFARTPMSGPARMTYSVSAVAIEGLKADDLFQVPQLAFCPAYLQAFVLPVSVAGDGNAGGIVSAIFKTPQPINNYGNDTLFAYVTDNSTHGDVLVDDFQRSRVAEK
jgi:hypothetical protein